MLDFRARRFDTPFFNIPFKRVWILIWIWINWGFNYFFLMDNCPIHINLPCPWFHYRVNHFLTHDQQYIFGCVKIRHLHSGVHFYWHSLIIKGVKMKKKRHLLLFITLRLFLIQNIKSELKDVSNISFKKGIWLDRIGKHLMTFFRPR
jgi:hypothetical protein